MLTYITDYYMKWYTEAKWNGDINGKKVVDFCNIFNYVIRGEDKTN